MLFTIPLFSMLCHIGIYNPSCQIVTCHLSYYFSLCYVISVFIIHHVSSDCHMSSHLSVCRVGISRSAWHDSHVIQLWPCLLLLTKLRQIVSKFDSFCCTDLRDPFRSHSCQSDVVFTIFPSVIRRRAISMLLTPGNSLFNFGDWFVGAKGQTRANPDYYCLSFRDLQKKGSFA